MNRRQLPSHFSRARIAAASLLSAVMCGCPAEPSEVHLTTAMRPAAVPAFGKLIAEYNKSHAATPIKWQNASSERELGSDSAATGWVIVSAATARTWSNRQSFTAALSPKVAASLIDGFADVRQTAADGTMLPLIGGEPLVIADFASIEKGGSAYPASIGGMLKLAPTHRKAVGRYLFAPPFGDAEQVLRFVHSQGAKVTTTRGTAMFPAGELHMLLQPWVDAYRHGDLPAGSLDWTEVEATRQMVRGVADMALGGGDAVDVVAGRPDKKSRRYNFFRPFTGTVDAQLVEPIGLVTCASGSVSLAAQNMAMFLMSTPAQHALADGYQAVPLASEPMKSYANVVKGVSEARTVYLAAVLMHASQGYPLLPLDPNRPVLAEAIRRALKDAVGGMPTKAAVQKAEAWFNQQVSGKTP